MIVLTSFLLIFTIMVSSVPITDFKNFEPFYRTDYREFLPTEMTDIQWAFNLAIKYTDKTYDENLYLTKAKKVIEKCGHTHSVTDKLKNSIEIIHRITPSELFTCLEHPISFSMKSFKKHKKHEFYSANAALAHHLFDCNYIHSTTNEQFSFLTPKKQYINFEVTCKNQFLTENSLAQNLFIEAKKGAIIFHGQNNKHVLEKNTKIDKIFMKSRIEYFNDLLGFNNWFLKLLAKPFVAKEVEEAFTEFDYDMDHKLSLDETIDLFGDSMSLISKSLGF